MNKISYCESVRNLPLDNLHRQHHDLEHGLPAKNDDGLFRRLVLEISQAGLSFDIALKKKSTIYKEFSSIKKVSKFKTREIEKLMKNPRIIRNKLKIESIIFNANKILEIQKEFGSFKSWLDLNKSNKKVNWIKLFKRTFRFTGPQIVNEFLMSACYLPGAHEPRCKYYSKIMTTQKVI